MSRKALMSDPVCLIENDKTNQLLINMEALQILTSITEPLVVVAIVGKYRTGKSYLMNNLAGCNKGFPLGSTIQSKTKGIWMWCIPHPLKDRHVLVLLDTEGLGDVEKGDSKNDAWIFCLAVLLSSNFVFNSMGTIDQQAMEQLHYVTELTKRIRLKASQEDEFNISECKRVFPSFTWCVRDFTLDLIHDGKEITEDEYLTISLKCKDDPKSKDTQCKKIEDYNLPRRCIQQYFHSHKCFVFVTPVIPRKLKNLENITNDELDEEFVAQSKSFCKYIFRSGSIKTLPGAIVVNGRMLGSLAVSYVEAIKSGSVPCMENAVVALAESENIQAVKDAVTKYNTEMNKHVRKFPTETELEFFQLHMECEKIALELFLARSFKDNEQKHQHSFKEKLDRAKERFSKMNEDASIRFCENLLDELGQTLRKNISENYYLKPGGHKIFLEEKMQIMEIYDRKPGRGIKAHEVQQEFLAIIKDTEITIRNADCSLTKQQKEIEAERARAEAARREKELAQEYYKKLEEHLEEEQKRFDQHVEMLQEKMEAEREKMKQENLEVIERLQKTEDMRREDMDRLTKELRKPIEIHNHYHLCVIS